MIFFYIPIYIFLVTVSYDILAIVCLYLRCVSECMSVRLCIYVYMYVCMMYATTSKFHVRATWQ